MTIKEVEEKTQQEVDVYVGAPFTRTGAVVEGDDLFASKAEDIKKMNGLTPAFKRGVTRGLEKKHQGIEGARSKKVDIESLTGYALMDVVVPPYNLDYLAKLYELSSAHKAAVDAKTSNIVGLGYSFVESPKIQLALDETDSQEKKDKITRKVRRGRIEMQDILDSLNEDDDFLETLKKVWVDYEATGNGYLEIGRTTSGKIGYLGHIPATSLRVRKQRDGFVQILSNKVVFFRNFGSDDPNPFANDPNPNEVIHIKKYSPTNTFYGIPDIISAQKAVAGNEFSERYNIEYFENKAVPRYIIVSKGANLSENAKLRVTEFFETALKRQNHRTLYIPLPAEEQGQKIDFEMKPVEAGLQDASFMNYHKVNLSIILMAHRVPITKVSAVDVPLAAASDLDKTFKEQVTQPEQRIFEKKLNKIIKELSDAFVLKLNELSLTDEDTQSQIDERNIRNSIEVPNEIRSRRGLPAIPDGHSTLAEKQMEMAMATKTDPAAQQRADSKATAGQTRTRDAQRSAGATDSKGEGRNAKGDGRKTA